MTPATSQRFTIPVDGTTNFIDNQASPPVISPDGRLIAYGMTDDEGVDQLWIRPIDSFDARPLGGTIGAPKDTEHIAELVGLKLVAAHGFRGVGQKEVEEANLHGVGEKDSCGAEIRFHSGAQQCLERNDQPRGFLHGE